MDDQDSEEHRQYEKRMYEKLMEEEQVAREQARICPLCGEPYGFGVHQRCIDLEQMRVDLSR